MLLSMLQQRAVLTLIASASSPGARLAPGGARASAPVATKAESTVPPAVGAPVLAHDLLQGANVDWKPGSAKAPPQTCILVHGILGSRRNLLSFAKRLVDEHPDWQFLLVDLRCHGESCSLASPPGGENTVDTAARDVIALLNQLKIYPSMLVGHSFGGKVVLSMVLQTPTPSLPRPVQVWVLDTVPGDTWCDGGDHPRDTISFCRTLTPPFESRKQLVTELTGAGFTLGGAQWMTTNLKARRGGSSAGFDWAFDLAGIAELYASYEGTNLWPMLESQPRGLSVGFVRAEHSAFLWEDEVVGRIRELGSEVHLLPGSSHWVHTDNPDGLLDIMRPSFKSGTKA